MNEIQGFQDLSQKSLSILFKRHYIILQKRLAITSRSTTKKEKIVLILVREDCKSCYMIYARDNLCLRAIFIGAMQFKLGSQKWIKIQKYFKTMNPF